MIMFYCWSSQKDQSNTTKDKSTNGWFSWCIAPNTSLALVCCGFLAFLGSWNIVAPALKAPNAVSSKTHFFRGIFKERQRVSVRSWRWNVGPATNRTNNQHDIISTTDTFHFCVDGVWCKMDFLVHVVIHVVLPDWISPTQIETVCCLFLQSGGPVWWAPRGL